MGIMEKKMETTLVYWGYIGIVLGFESLGVFRGSGLESLGFLGFRV